MASNITGIYNAIAAWVVTFDSDVTLKVWNYSAVKEALPSASAPIRILMPTEGPGTGFAFIALGKLNKITWNITDLCLIKPVAQGDGIASEAEHIVQYAEAYHTAMHNGRAVTASSIIAGGSITPGVYEWNGVAYYGVKCVVEVTEYVSAA